MPCSRAILRTIGLAKMRVRGAACAGWLSYGRCAAGAAGPAGGTGVGAEAPDGDGAEGAAASGAAGAAGSGAEHGAPRGPAAVTERGGRLAAQGGVDVGVRLAVLDQHRDGRADLAGLARGEHEAADDPGLLGAVLDDRLLGLDLRERVADGDGVAGRDEPAGDGRLGRARQHARHPHDRRHQPALPRPARTRSSPAATSSVRAIAARSRTLEMLGLASEPVTRCTGWSSQSKKRRWISSASQPP